MGKYADAASIAVEKIRVEGFAPDDAWSAAVSATFPNSKSSREKACPRGTFLGLCAFGLIRGVAPGDYGKSSSGKNARYAVAAADLIRESNSAIKIDEYELWRNVLEMVGDDAGKAPNHQIEVVVRIAEMGLLL